MALVANGNVQRNFVANVVASTVKLAALVGVVSFTADPIIIGAVTAGCAAVESITFLTLLHGTGTIRLRPALGGLMRVVLATGLAAGVVNWSGLGWHTGSGSTGFDILRGIAIGAMGMGVFGVTVALLWQASGRPEGAEKRLVQLVEKRLAVVRGGAVGWV
jgi:hypothetical protein